jgi:hypothetical protein
MGRPTGSPNRDKIYRQALMMELAAAGVSLKAAREIARAHIARCKAGDMQAIKEFADRLNGKPPQAIIGDNDSDPVRHVVRWQETDE